MSYEVFLDAPAKINSSELSCLPFMQWKCHFRLNTLKLQHDHCQFCCLDFASAFDYLKYPNDRYF